MLGALVVDEAHFPKLVLFVEAQLDIVEALVFRHGLELLLEFLQFCGTLLALSFEVRALGEIELRQHLGDLLIANTLVRFFKEADVLVESGHELCELAAFETSSAFTVANRHPIGGALHHDPYEFLIVLDVLFELALLDAIERRLRDIHVTAIDELLHVAEEEREQQRADVRTVDVGIRHQDDLAVTQLGNIEVFLADAGAERCNHGSNFFVAEHLVVTSLLDVEDFSLQRKDCLEPAIASLLGGSACGFTLDQVDFAALGLTLGAVGEFAGKTATIECALATGKIASFACGFTRTRSFDRLVDDLATDSWVLFEVGA